MLGPRNFAIVSESLAPKLQKIRFQSSDLFDFAIIHILCSLVNNAKGCIEKSNKSALWKCLSYRGLPYLFEVRSQTFRNNCKILTSKGLSENLKNNVMG